MEESHLVVLISLTDKSLFFLLREEAEEEEASLPDSSESIGVSIP